MKENNNEEELNKIEITNLNDSESIKLNDLEKDKEENLKNDIDSYLKINLNEREVYDQNINYLKVNPWTLGIQVGGSALGFTTSMGTFLTSCFVDSVILGTCKSGIGSILATGAAFSLNVLGITVIGGISIFLSLGIFGIKSFFDNRKYKKIKEYMEKMEKNENNSMKEEREIYLYIINKIINYYININELSELKKNKDIIKISENYVNTLNEQIKQKMNEIPNEINNFNVLLLGNTGVGKSTLINKFLKLKKNLCKIGYSARPERISEWKRYPLNDNDSEYKGIYLYDSIGIEAGNISQHLDLVNKFVEMNKSETEKQINCIWFCIHKSKFDEFEENYINKLLEIYDSKEKIPIIFIFTQAYRIDKKNVLEIEKVLKEIKYYKEGHKKLKYIEVLAEEFKDNDYVEKEKNLDKLREITIDCLKEGFSAPIEDKKNRYFYEIANKVKEIKEQIIIIQCKFLFELKKEENENTYLDLIKNKFAEIINLFNFKDNKDNTLNLEYIQNLKQIMGNDYQNNFKTKIQNFKIKEFISAQNEFINNKLKDKNDITQINNFKNYCVEPLVKDYKIYSYYSLFIKYVNTFIDVAFKKFTDNNEKINKEINITIEEIKNNIYIKFKEKLNNI